MFPAEPLAAVPLALATWGATLEQDGYVLRYVFDATGEGTGIPSFLRAVTDAGISFTDLETAKSSLEDIFVDLVEKKQ